MITLWERQYSDITNYTIQNEWMVFLGEILNINIKRGITGIILGIISLVVCVTYGNIPIGILYCIAFSAVGFIRLNIHNRILSTTLNLLCLIGGIFLVLYSSTFMVESKYGVEMTGYFKFLNIVCSMILFFGIYTISKKWRISAVITLSAMLVLCVINGFVYQFRGKEISPQDLFSITTAANVAKGYTFNFTEKMRYGVVPGAFAIFAQFLFNEPKQQKFSRLKYALVCTLLIFTLSSSTSGMKVRSWDTEATRINGLYLNLALSIRDAFIEKPASYSTEKVNEITEKYNASPTVSDKKPNIIVIMDESFSDFRMFGDKFNTNIPYTPFIDSLYEDTVRGYALSSVFGGNTANSEFEFLTGHSMAFLPENSVAYQQFLNSDIGSVVHTMNAYGYETFATHPYLANGWSRPRVYPRLGFSSYTFIEDYDTSNTVREYVGDRQMFSYVLDKLKNRENDKPLFLFGVTMQNHGGYDYYGENFVNNVEATGLSKSYPLVNQYLSLLNETDSAVEYLITQLKSFPEDTVVLFFGDHLPKVENEFYDEVFPDGFDSISNQLIKYKVPFFIWANYDIPEAVIELTSLNYLSGYLFDAAGLSLNPYQLFLKDMEKNIPALCAMGFYSASENEFVWHNNASATDKKYLNDYAIMQYNNLFDKKNRSDIFFKK